MRSFIYPNPQAIHVFTFMLPTTTEVGFEVKKQKNIQRYRIGSPGAPARGPGLQNLQFTPLAEIQKYSKGDWGH